MADPPIPNCTSRQNCVERCIVRFLFNKHRGVPTGAFAEVLLVDKQEFNQSEVGTFTPSASGGQSN